MSLLTNLFRPDPSIAKLQEKIEKIKAVVDEMELSFSKGGPVTWDQIGQYAISSPEKPIPYPTGNNCISYRLPDQDGKRVFYTVCVAPEGEFGSFGWHWHPKSREINTQLVGTAKHNGVEYPPFSITTFEPGTKHDYILPPGGSLLTHFEKIIE